MATYRIKTPTGEQYYVDAADNASREDILGALRLQLEPQEPKEETPVKAPEDEFSFTNYAPPEDVTSWGLFKKGLSRSGSQMSSLIGDVAPAFLASSVGADEYAKQQMEEAQAAQEEIARTNPPRYSSVSDIGKERPWYEDIVPFAAESLGEQGANIATMLIPGGAGAVLGRRAALGAAERALAESAEKRLAGEAAQEIAPRLTPELATARLAESEAGKRMLGQAAGRGAVTGAQVGVGAALFPTNIADTFQNIYDKTGQMAPEEAFIGGAIVGLLDMYSPMSVISAFRSVPGLKAEVAAKIAAGQGLKSGVIPFAKALAGGAAKGAVREAGTEMAQEEVSILAEQIAGDLQKTIGPEEIDRILTAGAKALAPGAVFGGIEGVGVRGRELSETQRQEAAAFPQGPEPEVPPVDETAARAEQLDALNTQIADLQSQIDQAKITLDQNPRDKRAQYDYAQLNNQFKSLIDKQDELTLTPEELALKKEQAKEVKLPENLADYTGNDMLNALGVKPAEAKKVLDRLKLQINFKNPMTGQSAENFVQFLDAIQPDDVGDIARVKDDALRAPLVDDFITRVEQLRDYHPNLTEDAIRAAKVAGIKSNKFGAAFNEILAGRPLNLEKPQVLDTVYADLVAKRDEALAVGNTEFATFLDNRLKKNTFLQEAALRAEQGGIPEPTAGAVEQPAPIPTPTATPISTSIPEPVVAEAPTPKVAQNDYIRIEGEQGREAALDHLTRTLYETHKDKTVEDFRNRLNKPTFGSRADQFGSYKEEATPELKPGKGKKAIPGFHGVQEEPTIAQEGRQYSYGKEAQAFYNSLTPEEQQVVKDKAVALRETEPDVEAIRGPKRETDLSRLVAKSEEDVGKVESIQAELNDIAERAAKLGGKEDVESRKGLEKLDKRAAQLRGMLKNLVQVEAAPETAPIISKPEQRRLNQIKSKISTLEKQDEKKNAKQIAALKQEALAINAEAVRRARTTTPTVDPQQEYNRLHRQLRKAELDLEQVGTPEQENERARLREAIRKNRLNEIKESIAKYKNFIDPANPERTKNIEVKIAELEKEAKGISEKQIEVKQLSAGNIQSRIDTIQNRLDELKQAHPDLKEPSRFELSVGKKAAAPATPESARAALERAMGRDVEKVTITNTPEEAGLRGVPATAKGAVVGGKPYLFTQNIEAGKEFGTFLHEVGDHLGMKRLVGEGNHAFLVNKVQEWASSKNDALENQIARAAMARIPEGTKANDEALAYFVEEAVDNFGVNPSQIKDTTTPLGTFFRKLMAGVKNILSKLGMKVDPTAQDLVDLAYGAAHLELRGDARSVTETPAFKKWFGDSKVVDESGEPLRMYIGMPGDMEGGEFRVSEYGTLGKGIYATPDVSAAGTFADGSRGYQEPKMQGQILPVYLKMEMPFDDKFFVGNQPWQEWAASILRQGHTKIDYANWTLGSRDESVRITKALHDKLMDSQATVADLVLLDNTKFEAPWGSKILEAIRKHGGFDGLILKNSPKGFDEYLVYKPTQIKSAIGNRGTFNAANPDIRYSLKEASENPLTTLTPRKRGTDEEIEAAKRDPATMTEFASNSNEIYDKVMGRVDKFVDGVPKWGGQGILEKVKDFLDSDAQTSVKKLFIRLRDMQQLAEMASIYSPEKRGGTKEERLESLEGVIREIDRVVRDSDYKLSKGVKTITDFLRDSRELTHKFTPEQMKTFGRLFHESTLRQVDYSDAANANNPLVKEFKKQPPELQKLHFDIYKKYAEFKQRQLDKLNEEEVLGTAGKLMAKLLKKEIKPYAPLYRKGDFWLQYENPETKEIEVAAFETKSERRDAIAYLRQKGIQPKEFYRLSNVTTESLPPTGEVRKIIGLLKQKDVDKSVINSVYQIYLNLFPNSSIMQNFRPRKGLGGFEQDPLLVFANMAPRMERSLEHFELAKELSSLMHRVTGPKGITGKRVSSEAVTMITDNLEARVDFFRNPVDNGPFGQISARTGQLSYYYFLWGNMSSALVQMMNLPVVAYPMLGGRYGFDRTYSQLMKAAGLWWRGGHDDNTSTPNPFTGKIMNDKSIFGDKSNLSKDERDLYETAVGRVLKPAIGHDLDDFRNGKLSDVSTKATQILYWGGWAFQNTERAMREMTLLATYRMAREGNPATGLKPMDHANAVEEAIRMTEKINGAVSSKVGPELFQQGFGKVIGTFKRIQLAMIYLAAQNFKQAFLGASPEVRKIARRQFLGINLMAFTFAGLQGLPVYGAISLLTSLAASWFGDDDEPPFDLSREIMTSLGPLMADGPVSTLTQIDIGGRSPFSNLLFRSDEKLLEDVGPFLYAIQQASGPFGGIIQNTIRGGELWNQGNTYRAFEAWMPSVAKNVLKGIRIETEGATNPRGYKLVEDPFALDGAFQIVGFTPKDISEAYAKSKYISGDVKFATERRSDILRRANMARFGGDTGEYQRILREDMREFNKSSMGKRNPLTMDSFKKSYDQWNNRINQSLYGFPVPDKYRRAAIEEFGEMK